VRRATVLVVDDERAIGAILVRILRGHDVTAVTSAKEALEIVEARQSFDVIFSDVMMPEMSGIEFYEELRRRRPALAERVIFITGGAFTDAAKDFLERVPNARLDKPFDVAALRAMVDRLVMSR
jgi:CheY-like chemotaxis protein